MTNFPCDEESREAIRMEIMEEYHLRAYRQAVNHMRSLRCQKGDHKCRNNGSSCLCRCHDQKMKGTE